LHKKQRRREEKEIKARKKRGIPNIQKYMPYYDSN